jgi:MFS family permease
MVAFIRSLFRHFTLKTLGSLFAVSLGTAVLFLAALAGPLLLASNQLAGLAALTGGFVVTGQALAVAGRLLDRKFRKEKPVRGGVLGAWGASWAEGLVLAAVFLGLFSLIFSSVPYYSAQGTGFSIFSLATLGVGSVLVLGGLPYFLPVRRREGLGLAASLGRSFQLMNRRPGLAAAGLAAGLLALAASVGTLGIFPGFGGLIALHQGLYDLAVEKEA